MVVSAVVAAGTGFQASGPEPTWAQLIERVAQADQTALAELYDHTSPMVFGLGLRIVGNRAAAEDVTLEVYLQVWREASHYSAERGAASSWLLMLARSRAIDSLRSRTRKSQDREESFETLATLRDPGPTPEDTSAAAGRRRTVQAAVAKLAPKQGESNELAFFAGMSDSEIADWLEQPLGTVKTRTRLGMLRLRELLQPLAEAL